MEEIKKMCSNEASECEGPPVVNATGESSSSTQRFEQHFEDCIVIDFDPQLLRGISQNGANNIRTEDSRKSNYICQILNSTYEGQFQLASYDFEEIEGNYSTLLEKKKTTYFSKHKVAKLVINNEFWRTKSYSISPDRLEELAEATHELFPSTLKESYYSKSSTLKTAGGAFQSYYGKQREREIAIGRLKVDFLEKRKRETSVAVESEDLKSLLTAVQFIDEDYKKRWSSTALEERLTFYKKSDIDTIFQKFSNLSHSLGYSLVEADFKAIHGTIPSDSFMKNWPSAADKIIKLAKKKKATDDDIKEILKDNTIYKNEDLYSKIKKNTLFSHFEHKSTLALLLLPYIFKRVTKQTKRSKTKAAWNPQKLDVLKTFIFHIKDTENFKDSLQDAHDELLQMHNDHKIKLQPYVVINGPSLSDIKAAYVILDNHKYQVLTPTSAVDLCFKCTKVFDEKFSPVCNHVWQFIEREIYKFEIKDIFVGVANVIENLQKL